MAKKNDKNRKKRYIEWLKETENCIRNKKKRTVSNSENSNKNETECTIGLLNDVSMSITKVKKKNIKLDRKCKRRLAKLSGVKSKNISMSL